MTKIVSLLVAVGILCAAFAPVVYAYAALA
jgi:hypothetical protein